MPDISARDVIQLFLHPESAASIDAERWQQIILVLRYQQLLARYAKRIRKAGVFEQVHKYAQHHLINAEIIADKQYQQVHYEASLLQQQIGGIGSHLIFLKGAGYSLSGLSVGVGRTYSDIDILVDKTAISDIEKTMSLNGWLPEEMDEYDQKYYRQWAHEIPPMKHATRGTLIDIHHNIIPVVSTRAPDINLLFEHTVITKDGYQILDKPAMTLHSLIHLFYNEEFKYGYRDLLDLHLLMSDNTEEYWQQLLDLAESTGFERELFYACRYTNRLTSTAIPEHVVNLLNQKNSGPILPIVDFIFTQLLIPSHPTVRSPSYSLAAFMGFLRGHHLKMPLPVLIYHSVNKAWRLIIEYFLGNTFFDKEKTH
ncbi:nucleotidyltransferase family protein [Hahella ganghwensis]|uniref:nucleotidyltransferase family protein n=1 Tax=Hahella ganghwensis TaxID=286420 RepID=UPI00036478FC|nr:nucleotidyltransferase family protein [Hahella ganghwensis]